MGALAVQTLLERLHPSGAKEISQIAVEPELIVRESTGASRRRPRKMSPPRVGRRAS
jgi:DNA-binding LacI/PurR family transcriptional regulator